MAAIKNLREQKNGMIVTVLISNPVIQASYAVAKTMPEAWWDITAELIQEYDPKLFEPIRYCLLCNWIEDGGHRIAAAIKLKRKTIKVEVRDKCISPRTWIHSERGDWDPPWVQDSPVEFTISDDDYRKALFFSNVKIGGQKDEGILEHTFLKWMTLKNMVDFKGKKVMDMGCHVGPVAIGAVLCGAKWAIGFDVREDLIKAADVVKAKHKVNRAMFFVGSFNQMPKVPQIYDITMCLGVLHKFQPDQYKANLKVLCNLAKESVIIDVLVDDSVGDSPHVIREGGDWPYRTIVSSKWLKAVLGNFGFRVVKKIQSKKYPERSMLRADRIK